MVNERRNLVVYAVIKFEESILWVVYMPQLVLGSSQMLSQKVNRCTSRRNFHSCSNLMGGLSSLFIVPTDHQLCRCEGHAHQLPRAQLAQIPIELLGEYIGRRGHFEELRQMKARLCAVIQLHSYVLSKSFVVFGFTHTRCCGLCGR